jgi:hypothetical protein
MGRAFYPVWQITGTIKLDKALHGKFMAQGGMVHIVSYLSVLQVRRRSSSRSSCGEPEMQDQREGGDAADAREPECGKPQEALGERLGRCLILLQ